MSQSFFKEKFLRDLVALSQLGHCVRGQMSCSGVRPKGQRQKGDVDLRLEWHCGRGDRDRMHGCGASEGEREGRRKRWRDCCSLMLEEAGRNVRELAPMGRMGQSMRLVIWSVTKRSCETGKGSGVRRICLAVNKLCGKMLGRGGVRCSA